MVTSEFSSSSDSESAMDEQSWIPSKTHHDDIEK